MPPLCNSVTSRLVNLKFSENATFYIYFYITEKNFFEKVLWGCPVGIPFLWGRGRILVSKASQFSDKRLQLYAFNNWFYLLCKFSISIIVILTLRSEVCCLNKLRYTHSSALFSIFDRKYIDENVVAFTIF